jgi:peptide deformylase
VKYEVVTYGHPVLREKSRPVGKITAEIRQLARNMLETMYRYNGAGLAAQQIARTESICVIDVSMRETPADRAAPPENPGIPMPLVLINPQIVEMKGEQVGQEGCLSFPEIFVNVQRAAEVTATFMNLEGRQDIVTGRGLFARAIQHELDHLNGVLLVDHMSAVQKVANTIKLKRLRKEHPGGRS